MNRVTKLQKTKAKKLYGDNAGIVSYSHRKNAKTAFFIECLCKKQHRDWRIA